eukprot:s274_g12.t1
MLAPQKGEKGSTELLGKEDGLVHGAVDNAMATIKEVLTFRLQEAAVDAIITGKRKGQSTKKVKHFSKSLDSDMKMLMSLKEDVSRLTGKSWLSRAIFVNVVSSHSLSGAKSTDGSTHLSDDVIEAQSQGPSGADAFFMGYSCHVAQMLSQVKQPVVGIALHPVQLPGILVLDACDFVIATRDHKGTHIDRVFAEEPKIGSSFSGSAFNWQWPRLDFQDQLNDYVQLLLQEVAGSSRSMLKRQKRHLVQQKILARLPTASTPDPTMSHSSSGGLLPLSKAPHSASTRASVSSENGDLSLDHIWMKSCSSCSFTACPSRSDG